MASWRPGNRTGSPRPDESKDHGLADTSATLGATRRYRKRLDNWSANTDHTGMADHKAPDYELEPTLTLEATEQYRALFEETRLQIVDLLLERAATIKELSETLGIPRGTIGHHVAVLKEAGLIRLVRTKKVRAIEAKYYGRTARTYLLTGKPVDEIEMAPDTFLAQAATAYAMSTTMDSAVEPMSTLRHARIPDSRAREWAERLTDLVSDFTAEERQGDTTYGLLVAFYPTDRPHLPDHEGAR